MRRSAAVRFSASIPGKRIYVPQAYGALVTIFTESASVAVLGPHATASSGKATMATSPVFLHVATIGADPCVILAIHAQPDDGSPEKFFLAHLDMAKGESIAGPEAKAMASASSVANEVVVGGERDIWDIELDGIRNLLDCSWENMNVTLATGSSNELLVTLYKKLQDKLPEGKLTVIHDASDAAMILEDCELPPIEASMPAKFRGDASLENIHFTKGQVVKIASRAWAAEVEGRDQFSLKLASFVGVNVKTFYIGRGHCREIILPPEPSVIASALGADPAMQARKFDANLLEYLTSFGAAECPDRAISCRLDDRVDAGVVYALSPPPLPHSDAVLVPAAAALVSGAGLDLASASTVASTDEPDGSADSAASTMNPG